VSSAALAVRQVRFTNKAFWRNPASAFFTFAFPLMFLVIFTALLGSGTSDFGRAPFVVHIKDATYYVVAMGAFGVISATYTNIAMSVTFQRDAGVLKRVRGTPLPSWAYLFGRVLHAMIVAAILVVITMLFGKVFPVKPFMDAIIGGYLSDVPNADRVFPFHGTDLLVIAGWGVVGLVLAARFFSWEPRR